MARSAAYPTLVVSLANQSDAASVVAHAFALEAWRDEISDLAFHLEGRIEAAPSGESARLVVEGRSSAFLSEHPLDEARRNEEAVKRAERLLRDRRTQMTGLRVVAIVDGTRPEHRVSWDAPIQALQSIRAALLASPEVRDLTRQVSESISPIVCTLIMLTSSDGDAQLAWANTLERGVHDEEHPVGCIYLSPSRNTLVLEPKEMREQARQALRLAALEDFGSGDNQRQVLPRPNGAVRWRLWTMRDGEQDLREAQARKSGEQHVKYLLDAELHREEDLNTLRQDDARDHADLWADRLDHPEKKPGLASYAQALNQLGAHIEAVGHRVADGAIEKLRGAPLESHPTWGRDTLAELQHHLDRVLTNWAYVVGNDLDCEGDPEAWAARVHKLHATGPGIGASALLSELVGKDGAAGRLGSLRRAREGLSSTWQDARATLTGGFVKKEHQHRLETRLSEAKDDALRVLNESPTADAFRNAIVPIVAILAWFAAPWFSAAASSLGTGPMPPNAGSIPMWLLDVFLWSIPEGLALMFGPVAAPFSCTFLFAYATWRLLRYQRDVARAQQERLLGPQGRVRAEILSAARRSHVVYETRTGIEEWINRTVSQAVDRSLRSLTRYAHQVRTTEQQLKWLASRGFSSLWSAREKTDASVPDDRWSVVLLSDVTFVLDPPPEDIRNRETSTVIQPSPLWTDDLSPGASDARADTLLWPRRFLKQRGLREEWTPFPSVGTLVGTSRFGPHQNYDDAGMHFILRDEASAVWQRMERLETADNEERKWDQQGIRTLPTRDELRVVWLHRKELPK